MSNQPPYNDPNNPYNQGQNNPYNQGYNQQYNQQGGWQNPPPYGGGQGQPPFGGQADLPNATAVLVLGICAIVLCGLGPILGTIALVMYSGAKKAYDQNPSAYTDSSFRNLNAGRTCGIIGLIIGALVWIFYIFWIIFVLSAVNSVIDAPYQNY